MNFRNPRHFQIQTERSNHTPGQPEELRQPGMWFDRYLLRIPGIRDHFITIVSGEMKSFQAKLEGRHSSTPGPVT